MAEGLNRLVSRAVDCDSFSGFDFGQSCSFYLLQYADDTLLVGKASYHNLWDLKAILRSFELVSGLKVNFHKSGLFGINVDEAFLIAGSSFL